jgi:hypothetical protein
MGGCQSSHARRMDYLLCASLELTCPYKMSKDSLGSGPCELLSLQAIFQPYLLSDSARSRLDG